MADGPTLVTDAFPKGRGQIRIGCSTRRKGRLSERTADPSPSPECPPPRTDRRGAVVPWNAPGGR